MIPRSLRAWFLIHFFADMLFALPLFIAPSWTMSLFGFTAEPLTARLVAAALFGIGGTSLFMRNHGKESYHAMLTLKITWATAALAGILLALIHGAPPATWLFLIVFLLFWSVWVYYKMTLQ